MKIERNQKGQFLKGRIIPEKIKQKMRKNSAHYWKGRKRPPMSETQKKNIGLGNTGKPSGTKGKHWKVKDTSKNSLAKKGNKNPAWKGGKSFEPYTTDWTETLRRSIRERDNYICQLCSQYGNVVHHIDYDKQNCNPDNLIVLCRKCNPKVNQNREYWTNFFNRILALIF